TDAVQEDPGHRHHDRRHRQRIAHAQRHPSYTGALMAFYGLALGMGNALSVAAIVVPVTWVFLHRIR
ncbi:phosphatidylethanolamine N-methyltransferase family protein, partial [Xanthomonas arboricola]|uniref:phosphatidylethanolamine N-methyltransferase family protein n=1 Tax=Xanthomonas arboricola TaxID=56448 RepID=UPI002158813C